jgi:hypothetical protein
VPADARSWARSCARRAKIAPQQLGLPVTARRRSRGLLREELAAPPGVSTTWYAYLGRAINPSAAVVECLARALNLDDA